MANAWAALLGSRKFWIGTLSIAATLVVNVLAILGKVPTEQVWPLVTGIVTMGGAIIAGTAIEDGALKFGAPPPFPPTPPVPPTPSAPPPAPAPAPAPSSEKPSSGGGIAGGIVGSVLLGVIALGTCASVAVGCSADANRKTVNTTLETAQILCILARSELADEQTIMKVCDIEADLEPYVHQILGQHRAAIATASCAPDGGAK